MKRLIITSLLSLLIFPLCAQSLYKSTLPIKPGKGITVAGTVECDGKPVQGVVVSDGYEVTRTDKKGAYYLKSKKQNPQVFISTPSGYEAVREDVVPQFWADFTKAPNEYERLDFRLKKVNQDRHAMIAITDVHLANQRNDVATFTGPYVDRIRKEVKDLNDKGMTVYTIHLGDGAWDNFWYALDFDIADFRKAFNQANYPTPLYNIMGNHDNDGSTPNGPDVDMNAARPYMKAFGPRYYSINVGGIHYVILDNIDYKNEETKSPKAPGIWGSRNYDVNFTEDQLNWLRKDLEGISHDTPLVLAMHCPLIKWKGGLGPEVQSRPEKKSFDTLMEIVEPFDEVHSISGHSHQQVITRMPGEKIRADHNIAGTSGAWWWTSAFGGKNLCPEGNPTGFEVFLADGNNLKWKHQTYEYEPDCQFWAWDMNQVAKYFKNCAEFQIFKRYFPKWSDFSEVPQNSVWIDVWSWDPQGTLKVTENGKELPVELFLGENPMYNGTYPIQRTVWVSQYSKSWETPKKTRLFRVQTSSPDTPIEISWTDCFGVEYKETLLRPKPFGLNDFK